jgi:ABC-type lipoprotein release transport system permease subunit
MKFTFLHLYLLNGLAAFVLLMVGLAIFGKVPVRYNYRNLVVRWRTTAMTALAFTLVVAVMVFMLAFVNGMYRLTESSGQPNNVIVLADGATDELFSNLGFGDINQIALREEVLKADNGVKLASWEVYLVVNQPIPVFKCPVCGKLAPIEPVMHQLEKHGDPPCAGSDTRIKGGRQRRFIQVRGVADPETSGQVHGLSLASGGAWFSAAGVQPLPGSKKNEQAIQAVIGEGLARELGPDQGKKSLELGDVFPLGPRQWIVTGIMKSAGSTFDSEVWTKLSTAKDLFGKDSYTTVVLRTESEEAAKELAIDLKANFKTPAVNARTEPEYYESLNATNKQFLIAIIIMAVIMAIGGVFGVMNTMFAAISQRTKDIGVLRIIGYSPGQVLISFFLESLLLALIGGIIGCAIGSLCHGWSASSIAGGQGGGGKSIMLTLTVDAKILGFGILFSLLMGCIGGFIPALSAMRLKPLESLR